MKTLRFCNIICIAFILSRHLGTCETESCKNGHCHSNQMNNQGGRCTLTPESDEGPFFLPNQPIRTDITEGKPGVPLQITFIVKDVKTCKVVKGATVHLWHPDSFGFYSAYSGYYPLGDPGSKQISGQHAEPTEKATFLRGIQITDENGKATFTTIYPGWYKFRTLHMHFKVTINEESKYTGEIYFPDELTDTVAKVEPYRQRPETRLRNKEDWQFVKDNGEEMTMIPKGDTKNGFEGIMIVVLDLNSNSN